MILYDLYIKLYNKKCRHLSASVKGIFYENHRRKGADTSLNKPWFCLSTGWCKRTVFTILSFRILRVNKRGQKDQHMLK